MKNDSIVFNRLPKKKRPKDPKRSNVPNINFSLVEKSMDSTVRAKYTHQRKTRGFDDTELWNLDLTILRFILPRLKAYREFTPSTPQGLDFDQWRAILDEIIEGFEIYVSGTNSMIITKQGNPKVKRAISLFCEHIFDLWF